MRSLAAFSVQGKKIKRQSDAEKRHFRHKRICFLSEFLTKRKQYDIIPKKEAQRRGSREGRDL